MYFFALIVKHLGVNVMFNKKIIIIIKKRCIYQTSYNATHLETTYIYQASYNATHLETTYISGVI